MEDIKSGTLEQLMLAGLEENQRFFRANERLRTAYRDNMISVCLCGEGARHFVDKCGGFSKFTIWIFYQRHEKVMFPHQNIRRRKFEHEPFLGVPVEFYKRTVPRRMLEDGVEKGIISYLNGKESRLRASIKQCPIVGLYPDQIFGKMMLVPLAPSVCNGYYQRKDEDDEDGEHDRQLHVEAETGGDEFGDEQQHQE